MIYSKDGNYKKKTNHVSVGVPTDIKNSNRDI